MKKKLIIFDCDGVLVDSEVIANGVDAELFTTWGYPLTVEESIRQFTGMSLESVARFIQEKTGKAFPENFQEIRATLILKALEEKVTALNYSLVEDLFSSGFPICIASGSWKERILDVLKWTKQSRFFREKHIFEALLVPQGKPAPDLFLFAAKEMGYTPDECLVIEDSVAGIRAAKRASMEVFAFLGGSHAAYSWYREAILLESVPTFYSSEELKEKVIDSLYS